MIADPACVTKCPNCLGRVLKQRFLESGIGPGLGYNARANMGADPGLIGLDDGIQRRGIKISFFGQNGFKRADAQFRLGKLRMIVVMVVIAICQSVFGTRAPKHPSHLPHPPSLKLRWASPSHPPSLKLRRASRNGSKTATERLPAVALAKAGPTVQVSPRGEAPRIQQETCTCKRD